MPKKATAKPAFHGKSRNLSPNRQNSPPSARFAPRAKKGKEGYVFYFLFSSGTGTIAPSANFNISADIFFRSLSTTVLNRNGR